MWLNSYAKGMCFTSPVHGEDVYPVLFFVNEFSQAISNNIQFSIRQEALADGFLSPGAVSFQEMAHLAEPPALADVIGDEVKGPVHLYILL